MRLIDTILSIVILSISLGFFTAIIVPCGKIYKETKIIESSYERDRFICLGFRKVCTETRENLINSEIEKFKDVCLKMWNLDYLTITNKKNIYKVEWQIDSNKLSVLIKR